HARTRAGVAAGLAGRCSWYSSRRGGGGRSGGCSALPGPLAGLALRTRGAWTVGPGSRRTLVAGRTRPLVATSRRRRGLGARLHPGVGRQRRARGAVRPGGGAELGGPVLGGGG